MQFIYNKCMIMFASFYSHKLKCKDIDMFYLENSVMFDRQHSDSCRSARNRIRQISHPGKY